MVLELKIGVVLKPVGVCHKPVLAMVMLLPFSLNAASFSRLGRRYMVTCTTAAQEGTFSSDPMVGYVLPVQATVGAAWLSES